MLTEILMESLLSMDEDTLDRVLESCSEEELELIDSAMEATTEMTAKDREDFNTIERIQRKARSSGWGSVPKKDRDEFVKIMSNTDNLKVLKKAKSLGEREASYDDRVKGALKSIGLTAGGAAVGAGAGAAVGAINQSANNIDKLRKKLGAYNDEIVNANSINKGQAKDYNRLLNVANRGDTIFDNSDDLYYFDSKVKNAAKSMGLDPDNIDYNNMPAVLTKTADFKNIQSMDLNQLNILQNKIEAAARSGAAKGAGVGALTGAGISAALAAIKRAKRYNKDAKDVMSQGDAMHPDKQWKLNRKYKK